MNTNPPDDEQRDWVERTLLQIREGEASQEDIERLRNLLMTDGEARRVYLEIKQMEWMLETVPERSMAQHHRAALTVTRSRWSAWARAGVAAAAALMLFVWQGIHRDAEMSVKGGPVATVTSSYQAVFNGREVQERELPLHAGTFTLERGSVRLAFACGADVVIEGPAVFDLVDATTMHLNRGSLWAHCPESARGFLVRMPGGRELVDLGTEFGTRVDDGGAAEVQVIKGEVKVSDAISKPLNLTEGNAAGWTVTAPPVAMSFGKMKPFQNAATLTEKIRTAPSSEHQTRVQYEQPSGDWSEAGNWTSKALPGTHELERVVINDSKIVRVTQKMPRPAHPVDMNVSNGSPATLEIADDLECQILRIATADGARGTVIQTGGTLNVTESFIASSHDGATATSTYTLSHGALQVGHDLAIGTRGPSVFTLQGSNATVSGERMNLGTGATLAFVLDADGAGVVQLRDTLDADHEARLQIDGSQYRGGTKTIPLVICGAQKMEGRFQPASVSLTGFQGVTARVVNRPGSIDLELTAH